MTTPEQRARPWVESVSDEHGAGLVARLARDIAVEQQPDAEAEIAEVQAAAEATAWREQQP